MSFRLFDANCQIGPHLTMASGQPHTPADLLAEMVAAYERFADEFDLIEVPDDYNPIVQMQKNVARNQGEEITDKVPALD